jgi:GTP 3',8-cyclase
MALVDYFGRQINYLRLSVTDRCNLRCQYCMPAEGVSKLCHSDILSYEDLFRVATESVALGVEKIRLTGGEPLVRKGLVEFVAQLTTIKGLKQVVLTTNGVLLRELALPLRRAGLHRMNVSVDSLQPQTFAEITRGGDLSRVLDGLAAAEEAGFPPPKINVVVMRGVNDDEVLEFAALTIAKRYKVRFIECMPTMQNSTWQSVAVTGNEILQRIEQRYTLVPLPRAHLAGPSRNFGIEGAAGEIGVITPMSSHFCETCNRIRITASGLAKGCLFGTGLVDLKPCLALHDGGALREMLRQIIIGKPIRHELLNATTVNGVLAMSQIGG